MDLLDQLSRLLPVLPVERIAAGEGHTAALRGKLNMILPPVRYLRMFKELGGEFITVGSGAHGAESLGADLSEGISLVAEAGFDNYCYFDRRNPVFISIE